MALDSALEAGAPLIVANMLALRSYPMTLTFAPDSNLPHEEDLEAVRATAARAAAIGIPTTPAHHVPPARAGAARVADRARRRARGVRPRPRPRPPHALPRRRLARPPARQVPGLDRP